MKGKVYILINPAMQNMVKIGKTVRQSEERAWEMSQATGVPTPFVVAWEQECEDCDLAERVVHRELHSFRVSYKREFFQLPLKEAIRIVSSALQDVIAGPSDDVSNLVGDTIVSADPVGEEQTSEVPAAPRPAGVSAAPGVEMESGYKTSLVRSFRLQRLSYEDLVDFCAWLRCEPPAPRNWKMEWARCERAADTLRTPGATSAQALEAARFGDEPPLAGERAGRILAAAEVLVGRRERLEEQADIARWAERIAAWKSR